LCAHAALFVLQDEFNYAPKIAKDWDIHAMLFLVRMRASATRPGIRWNIRYSTHKRGAVQESIAYRRWHPRDIKALFARGSNC
jgi:hypothetical protein